METVALLHEIDTLPAYKRMFIAEQIIHSIRLDRQEDEIAADSLYDDYKIEALRAALAEGEASGRADYSLDKLTAELASCFLQIKR